MMTKQTRTLALLAAAVVVCGGAYGALRVWNDRQAQADGTVYVTNLTGLTQVSFTNAYGDFSFTKADGTWEYDGDTSFPAGQEALEDLAEQVGTLAATRVIDDPEDLSSYGLDAPALQASVTAEDGQSAVLLLGDTVSDYCYAKLEGSDTVYTISTDLPDQLEELELLDLAAIPDFPALGTDTVSSLTWEQGESALTLTKTETEGEDGEAERAWDVNGAAIPDGNTTFSSLMAQLSSLSFTDCYDYKGEGNILAECGLTEPAGVLTVSYGDGETLTLTLGALDETGESCYAQIAGDRAVYRLSADAVDTLTGLTAEQLTAVEEDEDESGEAASQEAAGTDSSGG